MPPADVKPCMNLEIGLALSVEAKFSVQVMVVRLRTCRSLKTPANGKCWVMKNRRG